MSGSWKAELVDEMSDHAIDARAWNLGQMIVTVNDFPARRVSRSQAQARGDQLDHYYVHLPLAQSGLTLEAEDSGRMHVPAGEAVLMDLARPFDTLQGDGRSLQAFMPREMLDELLPTPRDMHATRLQGAAARVLSELLQSLTGRLPRIGTVEASHIAKGTMHMVAASLAPTPVTLERARPTIDSSLRRQACRLIEMHLKDPEFGATQISEALRVSRATLYRLFEPYGGVIKHIQERRLVTLHDIIRSPRRVSLAVLADEYGFKSASQFSRAFRQHFGYPPSEASERGAAAGAHTPEQPEPPVGESLAAWLQPLRG